MEPQSAANSCESGINVWQTLLLAMIHQPFTHRKLDLRSICKTLQNTQDLLVFVMLHKGITVSMMCLGALVSLLILSTQMNVPGRGSSQEN